MPSPDPATAFSALLQADIAELALRANRLHELVELGEYYRQVDGSYRPLVRQGTVRSVRWGEILDSWASWKRDLEILYAFIQSTHHIRQRLETEIPPGVGPAIDELTRQLRTLCEKVETACHDRSQGALSEAMPQVDMALRRQIGVHKVLVDREVERLCRLTEQLRERLK